MIFWGVGSGKFPLRPLRGGIWHFLVTLLGEKNLANPHPIIICHTVLDELWPLVLKHSYALARLLLAAAQGSDYWRRMELLLPHQGRGVPGGSTSASVLVLRQPVLAGWCCSAYGTR